MRVLLLLLFLSLSACTMRKETAADHVVHRGEFAVLTIPAQEHAYLALAHADAHALAAAVDVADASRIKVMTDSGKALSVDNRTAVRVVSESFNERQVEITAGPAEGKRGWVPYEWLKPKPR